LRPCFISDELALDILETGKSLRLLKDLFPVEGPSLNDYIKHFIDQDDSICVLPTWKFIISNESQDVKANGRAISTDGQQSTTATLDMEMFGNSYQLTVREKHACDDSFILPSPKRQRHNPQAKPDSLKTPIAQELSLPEITSPPTSTFIKLLEDFQICEFKEQHETGAAAHMPPLDAVTAASVEQPLSRLCRSLNTSVMAYFFKNLQLLQYLQALQDYFTFKNGDFYSNAMDALFRSDLDEDQPGGLVTIGLPKSIKSRKWPPSSIDLNIALKDVLLNSSSNFDDRDSDMARNKLSVGEHISFSVRQNMDSSAKWTNPQSLEAVDFLQLSYSPPYPLNIVITPTIIEKYNRVFSFLLRLFRVRLVVQNMHKCMQARRGMSKTKTNAYLFIEPVRFQFAQFVDALHGYVMDAVITSNWKAYMRHLETMAYEATTQTNNDEHSSNDVTDDDLTETIKLMMDLDTLRTYNEYFVELLLHQCILKRKQQGILRIIETLLGSVLALAALISDFDAVCYDKREPTENEIRKLHRHCTKIQNRFHSQMKTLVAILASLQARDSGDIRFSVDQRRLSKLEVFAKYYEKVASADGAVNCYERLLLRLDFNGYYQDVQ
jgi:Gamma tubulin complex component C-terminal